MVPGKVLRRALLIGGLVIIADLATRVVLQRTPLPEEQQLVGTMDEIANYALFSLLGILVVRDTRIIYMGAMAGFVASLLDAVVVAAAGALAPTSGPATIEEVFISNMLIGTLFAGMTGIVYGLVQNWSSGRKSR